MVRLSERGSFSKAPLRAPRLPRPSQELSFSLRHAAAGLWACADKCTVWHRIIHTNGPTYAIYSAAAALNCDNRIYIFGGRFPGLAVVCMQVPSAFRFASLFFPSPPLPFMPVPRMPAAQLAQQKRIQAPAPPFPSPERPHVDL